HELLVRVARAEVVRRGPRVRITGPELDDLACQAAADALMAVTGKLGQFRGESRFTTWACRFVIFEVSAKIGRHFWRHPSVPLDAEDWDRLPGHFGFDPAYQAKWRELFAALRRAVDTELTPRQREVFVAILPNDVPLDTPVLSPTANQRQIVRPRAEHEPATIAALVTAIRTDGDGGPRLGPAVARGGVVSVGGIGSWGRAGRGWRWGPGR